MLLPARYARCADDDKCFVDLIIENYPIIYAENMHISAILIKMEIRSLTILYAKNKAKK